MTRRNPTRRHTIASALARVRGARTSAGLAEVRYGRHELVAMLVRQAIAQLNRAERTLLEAKRRAVAGKTRRAA